MKALILTMLLIGFVISAVTNFDPSVYNGKLCFTVSEANELLDAAELRPMYENKISVQTKKIYMQSNQINTLRKETAIDKKKKVRLFFNGVLVGSGVSIIGIGIVVIKLIL